MAGETARQAVLFVVDSGGSHTLVRITTPEDATVDIQLDSMNPSSVGKASAMRVIAAVVDRLRNAAQLPDGLRPLDGIVASAGISPATLARWSKIIVTALTSTELSGRVLVTNDLIPLLLGEPLLGCGAITVVGTGSAVLGGGSHGSMVHIGGMDYLASDEGSAYHLGRLGLVAAARAFDGRGAATSLLGRLQEASSLGISELARQLAEMSHPRPAVARLATHVTAAWVEDSDDVAEGLIRYAADELGLMARRASELLPKAARENWVITGGVVENCAAYAELVVQGILSEVGSGTKISLVPDCLDAGISLLKSDHDSGWFQRLERSQVGPLARFEF